MADVAGPETPPTLPHVRVSLYGDCNFRCTYCPPWGENSYEIADNLSFQDLKNLLQSLAEHGFKVVKVTGGEPTLRHDLIPVIEILSGLFSEVRLITNGWRLTRLSPQLARAGLKMVEISIDAMDEGMFDRITQTRRYFPRVLSGLDACLEAGIRVQVNMVVMRENLNQVIPMLEFAGRHGPIRVKLLELVYYEYPGIEFWRQNFVEMSEVVELVEQEAERADWERAPGAFGSPMRQYRLSNGSTVVVKDGRVGAVYAAMCAGCPVFPCQDGLYGLSLTADGLLKMCKHRPDLHVPVPHDATASEIDMAVETVLDRYRSAYFLTDGWHPTKLDTESNNVVQPSEGIARWYRGNMPAALKRAFEEH